MSTTCPRTGRLLIVDDEVDLMRAMCKLLTGAGFHTVGVTGAADALKELSGSDFELVITDLMMTGMNGIDLLRRALEIDANLVVIVMTGKGTIETAVEAMRSGAFDYILKPFRLPQVQPVIDRALEFRRLRVENIRLRNYVEHLQFESPRYQVIGTSPAIRKVLQLVEKVAPTDATVLIRGPSGSGKELIARALHGNSTRRGKPLVTVNCATLQDNLLESELFGHEKGAFTGADKAKPGLFEIAEEGTLFIDEVAEMAPAMQAKLLRVLENGRYRRIGSTQERHANVRIVAATNKALDEEQKAGRFREDLYFRLNVISINLPSLRDRREDIPLLIDHLLLTRQFGKTRFAVDPAARDILVSYDWPGNIRELANVIERAQILAEGNVITIDDLPEDLVMTLPATALPVLTVDSDSLESLEQRHIRDILSKAGGNKVQAAKLLGISRRTLYRMVEKYGIADPRSE